MIFMLVRTVTAMVNLMMMILIKIMMIMLTLHFVLLNQYRSLRSVVFNSKFTLK